ncbi:MAG: formate dehydrogenase accessory sulfurtransferase FdhD [Geopsychrobacter sp.]|nr:formate dehydrogenase accessory sulfurtransferase FdhD [Geopsychrobacter sp.]
MMTKIITIDKEGWTIGERPLVAEYPLRLVVNDRELTTLIASPHELDYLVTGFLRLQGLIETKEDLLLMGICQKEGEAQVRIRGQLPPKLRQVLTSGCGGGISFNLPEATVIAPSTRRYSFAQLQQAMSQLNRLAEAYSSHGGIHSAGVSDGKQILLYAEDLGRHNTLDRIAGEALQKRVDLRGLLLVTSGRISSEMAGKSSQLGIALLASRTSPTDMAVQLCEQAGMTMVGYLRGGRCEVYSHAERLQRDGDS